MEDPNNQKGFALALSSSCFIGASFIIKKQGLIQARGTGRGAGSGGFAYLYIPTWWAGLLLMVFGEVANFSAYGFAPAVLVTPMGGLSVVFAAVLASLILHEKLALLGKLGCALCLLGSTTIALNAPAEAPISSVAELTEMMLTSFSFILYGVIVLAVVGYLVYQSSAHGKSNVMLYVSICSLVGSLSVVFVKGLSVALKLTLEGNNQLANGSTWVLVLLVACAIGTQMNYLNKALDTFNTALVTSIYYVFFTTATIVANALLFKGWGDPDPEFDVDYAVLNEVCDNCTQTCSASCSCSALGPDLTYDYSTARFITAMCGFLTVCCGVFLLHFSRDTGDPMSPSSGKAGAGSSRLAALNQVLQGEGGGGGGGESIPMQTFADTGAGADEGERTSVRSALLP